MRGIKIPQQDFAPKMQGGGLMYEGGTYLRDTMVYAIYSSKKPYTQVKPIYAPTPPL